MDYYVDQNGEQIQAGVLSLDNVTVIASWAGGVVVEEIDPFDQESKYPALNIQCGSDVKRASLGDYVLRKTDGVFDVKRPFEFMGSYNRVVG